MVQRGLNMLCYDYNLVHESDSYEAVGMLLNSRKVIHIVDQNAAVVITRIQLKSQAQSFWCQDHLPITVPYLGLDRKAFHRNWISLWQIRDNQVELAPRPDVKTTGRF